MNEFMIPYTVPNRPTNGAVEPTVARKASPSCRRDCTSSTARCTLIVTQVFFQGSILASARTPYEPEATDEVVQRLMQAQHKQLLRQRRDRAIARRLGPLRPAVRT